jgi:hypothetical protein
MSTTTARSPLALTDQQFSTLLDAAAQLHPLDRDPFLRAVADRFAGRNEIGEGEFACALTSAFGEERTCPDILPAASRSKMTRSGLKAGARIMSQDSKTVLAQRIGRCSWITQTSTAAFFRVHSPRSGATAANKDEGRQHRKFLFQRIEKLTVAIGFVAGRASIVLSRGVSTAT